MRTEIILEYESSGDTIVTGALGTLIKGLMTGGVWNKSMSGDYPSNSIAAIGQNTKKSPRDSSGKPSANAGVKIFQIIIIIIIIIIRRRRRRRRRPSDN